MFGSLWRPAPLSSFLFLSLTLVVSFIAFLCVTLCWHAAGCPAGSCIEDWVFKSLLERQVCMHNCCVSQWPCVDHKACFLNARTRGALKKTDIHYHRRTARQQVGGNLSLFVRVCYHLLFPVKTGKDRGENGAVGKCSLDVSWLEVQPCLTVTLPARKNRPVLGVTYSGILHGVIFITFTKQWGMLSPAVDTSLALFLCVQNSPVDLGDVPSGSVLFGC